MMVTPPTSPTLVKRRLTPPKPASAARISSFFMPRWRATATAASALETLWSPGIGRVQPSITWPSACSAMSKCATPALVAQVDRPHIGLRVEAEGHDPPVGDPAHQRLHLGVVGAADGQPVERDVGDEIVKALAQVLDRAPVLHVLGVDVGDDGDGGGQAVEGAVAFVGLDHHPFALPHARVRAIGVDDAAIDHRRVDAAGIEQGGDHRGRRGLAMGAGDGDVGLQPHQLGQHLGAAHHRQAALRAPRPAPDCRA